MKLRVSKIKFSNNDIRSNLKIPDMITDELAEFIGIMVGDGHIGSYGHKKEVVITGNIKDKEYYLVYVNNLIFKVFNIKFNVAFQKSRNAITLRKDSKALFGFLNEIIKIPTRKEFIKIPSCIIKSSIKRKISFLRGLADADFCLTIKYKPHNYPVIHGTSKSERLILEVSDILNELGINNNIQTEKEYYKKRDKMYIKHRIYVNGFSRVNKFMNKIGFCNKNKLKIYEEINDN
jgi:intein/homing endonuclease